MAGLEVAQEVFLEEEGLEWRPEDGAGFRKAWEGNWKELLSGSPSPKPAPAQPHCPGTDQLAVQLRQEPITRGWDQWPRSHHPSELQIHHAKHKRFLGTISAATGKKRKQKKGKFALFVSLL